jgi:glycosyltransferase involved in cell wall biosynthesis
MTGRLNIVMATQSVDACDPLLAFTVGWIRALARRVRHLHVVCYHNDGLSLPANVRVDAVGTGDQRSRVSRLATFERAVWTGLRDADVFFAHMIPRMGCWGGAAAAARHVPMVLWYAHSRVSPELRVATAMSAAVATATADSFPLNTRRRHVLGHGIDADFFSPAPRLPRANGPLVVMVGRLSAIKRQRLLIEALPRVLAALPDTRVRLIGGTSGAETRAGADLQRLAADTGVADRVSFDGAQLPSIIRDALRQADVAVNLSPPGLFDKAALEAMLIGTPTIVANRAFLPLLDGAGSRWCLDTADASTLASAVIDVISTPAPERMAIASAVRERALAAHALEPFMDRLVRLLESVA